MVDLEREGRTTLEEGRAGGANSNLNYRGEGSPWSVVCGQSLKASKHRGRYLCLCRVRTETQFPAPLSWQVGSNQDFIHWQGLLRCPAFAGSPLLLVTAASSSQCVSVLVCPCLPLRTFKDTVSQSLGTHLQDRDLYIQEAFHMPNHSNDIMLKYSYLGESKGL